MEMKGERGRDGVRTRLTMASAASYSCISVDQAPMDAGCQASLSEVPQTRMLIETFIL